ncbi:MAG: multidrug transporter [Desulfuromonas sp.]|nr:MAG: multidrug transporter [Desulfuromonas sp.]
MKNILVLIATLLALSGCSLTPHYDRPEFPVADAWPTAVQEEKDASLPAWETFYSDPQLRQVITQALKNNRDLKVALLTMERTRALYRIEAAAALPQVDAGASASLQRVPADLSGVGGAITSRRYGLSVGVTTFELDFFGRVKNLKEEALQSYLATSEAQRSVRLSLVADVASSYLALAAARETLGLSAATLTRSEASLTLVRRRFEAGVVSLFELEQNRSQVAAARIAVAAAERQAAAALQALQLLVSAPLPEELLPQALAADDALLVPALSELPSSVLLGRPDIVGAEHQLMAATAHIGAARAAFFPSITLTGALGTASSELSGLFKGGAGVWSFAPQVSLPIFDAGRNRANLEVAKKNQEIAIAQYEAAIQNGFREVADALSGLVALDAQFAAQQELLEASRSRRDIALLRYEQGVDSQLTLLAAERELLSAESTLVDLRRQRLAARVTLYKVIGGGAF